MQTGPAAGIFPAWSQQSSLDTDSGIFSTPCGSTLLEGRESMIEARCEDLQQMLDARLRELESELDLRLRAVRANNGFDGRMGGGLDTAEASDADAQQDIGIALIEMKLEALRGARRALVRLASAAYGYCAECGGEISMKRLKAHPLAVRCQGCEDACEISERRSRPGAETRCGSPPWFERIVTLVRRGLSRLQPGVRASRRE
jgi:DnaK suppressor protein